MKRMLATLLVLVFSLPLAAPAFVSIASRSELPACCRRNGAHHCAMGSMSAAAPAHYRTVSSNCPWWPAGHVRLMMPHAVGTRSAAVVGHVAHSAARVREAEAGYRISCERTRQKRGPPAVTLL
jgi:hypothetical protein